MSLSCVEANLRMAVYDSVKEKIVGRNIKITGDIDRRIQASIMSLELDDMAPYFGQFSEGGVAIYTIIEKHAKKIANEIYNQMNQ